MLSFGRGRGASFRAGAESMSHFKADTTIAFLSLFPRSRITEMREMFLFRNYQMCVSVVVYICCVINAVTNLRGYQWLFGHKALDLKDSWPFDCPEICLLLAPDSPVTLLYFCLSGHFGNISGLSL